MRLATWIGSVAVMTLAAAMTACQPQSSPVTRPALPTPTAQTVAQIRAQYAKIDPDARVGVVQGVLAANCLAAVGDVPVADLAAGDVITFLDNNGQTITMGHVVPAIEKDPVYVYVKYDAPKAGGRVPAKGDIAVRAIK